MPLETFLDGPDLVIADVVPEVFDALHDLQSLTTDGNLAMDKGSQSLEVQDHLLHLHCEGAHPGLQETQGPCPF